MVTYVVVVVVVTLVLIVVVVVIFVFVVVVVPINIVVVVVVVVIIDIRRVSSGFIVRIWSDWNDVLHLAGRKIASLTIFPSPPPRGVWRVMERSSQFARLVPKC